MAHIIMYWGRIDYALNSISGFEVVGDSSIEVPAEACGFEIDQLVPVEWYFHPGDNFGQVFQYFGTHCAHNNPNIGKATRIVGQGPVGGCHNSTTGKFNFVTPLNSLGISGEELVHAGAGTFVAYYASASAVTWLNQAGALIPKADIGPDPSGPKLPPEFFDPPPSSGACIRDVDIKWHCMFSTGTLVHATSPSLGLGMPAGLELFVTGNSGVVPGFKKVEVSTTPVETVQAMQPIEIVCPGELRLTATFRKRSGMQGEWVRYRFRFAHGPVSTDFWVKLVDGAAVESHSVPFPLPSPVPGQGGPAAPGHNASASATIAIYVPPEPDLPTAPGSGGGGLAVDSFRVEPSPPNEHKLSVRVEVLNSEIANLASGWVSLHVVCVPGSLKPVLNKGINGMDTFILQGALNRWLEAWSMPVIVRDGLYGDETAEAVALFQRRRIGQSVGFVDRRTWRQVLAMPSADEPSDAPTITET